MIKGVAGIVGYGWVVLFTVGLNFSFSLTLFIALVLPVLFWLNFVFLFTTPTIGRELGAIADHNEKPNYLPIRASINGGDEYDRNNSHTSDDIDLSAAASKMTSKERFHAVLALWPWMVPLCVVYFAEYAMQSGVWASIVSLLPFMVHCIRPYHVFV
jgi:hypothetical protein